MEAKFVALEKRIKIYCHQSRWSFSDEQTCTLFDHKSNWEKFW